MTGSLTPSERLASAEGKIELLEADLRAVLRAIPWAINAGLVGLRNEGKITHLQLRSISEAVCKEVEEALIKHPHLGESVRVASRDIAGTNKVHR